MGIKVFIVDDHALVRAGFRLILGAEGDIEVIGEADSAEAALPRKSRGTTYPNLGPFRVSPDRDKFSISSICRILKRSGVPFA